MIVVPHVQYKAVGGLPAGMAVVSAEYILAFWTCCSRSLCYQSKVLILLCIPE